MLVACSVSCRPEAHSPGPHARGRRGGVTGDPVPPSSGAYPPPPPTRCSRPASLRSSPKHCVQQQFPIACRPGPPFLHLLPLKAQTQLRQPHPRGTSRGGGGGSGTGNTQGGTRRSGTKAAVTPGAAKPPRKGGAPGCGLQAPAPSAWPLSPWPPGTTPVTASSRRGRPVLGERDAQAPPSRASRLAPRRRRHHTPGFSGHPIGRASATAPPHPAPASDGTSASSRGAEPPFPHLFQSLYVGGPRPGLLLSSWCHAGRVSLAQGCAL